MNINCRKMAVTIMLLLALLVTGCDAGASSSSGTKADPATMTSGLKSAGLPLDSIVVYDATTDPNKLLGRPNQYTAKTNWHDARLPAPSNAASPDVSDGGSLEIFGDSAGAQARSTYMQTIGKSMPLFAEYDYVKGPVILRVSHALTPDQAAEYQKAFMALP